MMLSITHHPFGNGHPYAISADQRNPVFPVAGDPLWLGAVTQGDVKSVTCEFVIDGHAESIACERASEADRNADAAANAGGEGHLAEAQESSLHGEDDAWQTTIADIRGGENLRYRFVAVGENGEQSSTDWEDCVACAWVPLDQCPIASLEVHADGMTAIRPLQVQALSDGSTARRMRFALPLQPDEHVVGFGERYDSLDQRGLTPDVIVFEQYKNQGAAHRTYFPMPFAHVIGGVGWGFYLHTSRRMWCDVGSSDSSMMMIEAETGEDGHLVLDLYQGSPVQVLTAFLNETGRAKKLPDWVHRLWASGNEWNTQELVMSRMNQHRDEHIPVGVVVIEAWSDEEGITIFRDAHYAVNESGGPRHGDDFSFDSTGAWPDPKAMIQELHDRGIKVILWQIPLLKSEETFAAEHQSHGLQVICDGNAMVREGYAVREQDGEAYHNRAWWFPKALMPDLSTDEGRAWWAAHRRYLVDDFDIDGFKTDGGEHAWGRELRYNDGTRGDDGNNLNPVRYACTYCELLESCGKAPVTFSRSGFAGSQPYGAFWAGDENSTWEAFRASLRAGLSAAACGVVYWGWDLAGFSGSVPTAELYIRAAAASVFMPIMQYHSEFNNHELPLRDRTPWNIAEQNGDVDVVAQFRELVELRERLVPYLSHAAETAVESDRPLMRALFFDHAQDSRIWDHPYEYQLGDDLLINPVCEEGASELSTYLPERVAGGAWIDVWSGESHAPGSSVLNDVSGRTAIPVFCAAAAWDNLKYMFME